MSSGSPNQAAPTAEPVFLDPRLDREAIHPQDEEVLRPELLRLYRAMRLARTFESKLAALYRQGRIVGAVYLGTGQEAICTGVVSLLRPDDYFSTVARGLAGWFLRGVEPRHVLARWLGHDVPTAHGRELGLFLADLPQFGIAPYHNGSMASWIPSGAGFALAFKLRRQPRVYVAFTGDGATSPGDFYEGLNFAAIHKLPLVVMVENNSFAYSTPNAADARGERGRPRPRLRDPGRDRLRQRHLRGAAGGAPGPRARPQRPRAVSHRVQDLPGARTRRARRHGLRARGHARVLGAARPPAALPGVPRGEGGGRPGDRAHRRGVRADGGRGGGLGRGPAPARAGVGDGAVLRRPCASSPISTRSRGRCARRCRATRT